jgi:putative membrane protein
LVQFSLFIISIEIRQNENFPKILLTAFAVILLANILPGAAVGGYFSAIMVAIVISL